MGKSHQPAKSNLHTLLPSGCNAHEAYNKAIVCVIDVILAVSILDRY